MDWYVIWQFSEIAITPFAQIVVTVFVTVMVSLSLLVGMVNVLDSASDIFKDSINIQLDRPK